MGEQKWAEGTPGKAVPLHLKNGHWGVNYPAHFSNPEGKSLFGLERQKLQKLALVDDLRKLIFGFRVSELGEIRMRPTAWSPI